MTLDELFEHYMEDADLTHQETTLDTIRYRYNSQIKNMFGKKQLEDFDFKEIKKFQKDMVKGKYKTKNGERFSISYINGIIQLIKRLLKYAYVMNYVKFTQEQSRGLKSIHTIADKEKYKKTQIIWGINDFNIFIKEVDNEKYRVLFNVLFYAGIRKGEALSLCWKDVDLIDQTITINTTACRVSGKGQMIKSPKSKCSHRVVHINDSLNEMLLNLFLNERERYKTNINHHFVFGTYKMLSFSSLDRNFRKYKDRSEVSDMNLHGFRHSHATLLLQLTNDVYNVSKRLGHENIEITDTYLHVNSKIQKEMAEQIEKAIKKERVSTYDSFLERLKKDLKKELTANNYTGIEQKNIKNIYDYVMGNC